MFISPIFYAKNTQKEEPKTRKLRAERKQKRLFPLLKEWMKLYTTKEDSFKRKQLPKLSKTGFPILFSIGVFTVLDSTKMTN